MTDEEAKQMVLDEVYAPTIPGIEQRINAYYELHSSKSSNVEVRIAWTKVSVIRFMLGRVRELVDTAIGKDRFQYSQLFRHLMLMLDEAKVDLKNLDPSYSVPTLKSTEMVGTLPDSIQDEVDYRESYLPAVLKGS